MEAHGSSHDANINEDLIAIGSATSVEEILGALARRGCSNLTLSIDSSAYSELPCAQGGFCDVYQGVLDDGTGLAIKALRVYGDDAQVKILKRAARELYHWSKLHHCNVLPLLGLTIFQGRISLVSGWMENGSVASYIKSRPDTNRIKLCTDICAGLCYIHSNDMIHGDLKAANIVVSPDGTALIADFGNAALRDITLRFTGTSKLGLSIRWAAPELLGLEGSPRGSKEADVYAFGMTVLEALTGRVPFHNRNDVQVLFAVRRGEKVHRPDIGIRDDLWNTLNWCWHRDPTKRPRIASIKDHMQALFQPPLDTWSIHETASQSQGNEFNSRRLTDVDDMGPDAHARPIGEPRKSAASEGEEGDGREFGQRYMRSKFDERDGRHYSEEEEDESESEEEEEIEEQEAHNIHELPGAVGTVKLPFPPEVTERAKLIVGTMAREIEQTRKYQRREVPEHQFVAMNSLVVTAHPFAVEFERTVSLHYMLLNNQQQTRNLMEQAALLREQHRILQSGQQQYIMTFEEVQAVQNSLRLAIHNVKTIYAAKVKQHQEHMANLRAAEAGGAQLGQQPAIASAPGSAQHTALPPIHPLAPLPAPVARPAAFAVAHRTHDGHQAYDYGDLYETASGGGYSYYSSAQAPAPRDPMLWPRPSFPITITPQHHPPPPPRPS